MSILKVNTIQHANGTEAMTIDSSGNVTTTGNLISTGSVGGWKRIGSVEWTADTTHQSFDVDPTLYTHYKLYWYVSHADSTQSANSWTVASLVFEDSNGEITGSSQYDNNTQWVHSGQSGESVNASYNGASDQMWLAGNGAGYDSHGEAIISIPNSSSLRASIRGTSQLIGDPRQDTTAGGNYRESFSSVCLGQDPTAITKVRFRSWFGTARSSKYASVQFYGLEK